jgi:hypothetical protein
MLLRGIHMSGAGSNWDQGLAVVNTIMNFTLYELQTLKMTL